MAQSLPLNEFPDFQLLFESAPGLYLVLSPDFKIIAASDNYLQATMTKRPDILGKGLFEVFPDNPDDPTSTGTQNLRASLKRVLTSKASDNMAIQKYDILRPDSEGGGFEERHWSPVNTPVLDKNNEVKYIIHRVEDVTEFVKLKQERTKQNMVTQELRSQADNLEKLRQSQRMEAMGQLAGGVAHDFNNILAIIIMNCELMLNDDTIPEVAKKSFAQIVKTGERAATLTRQLLAFSRKQVLQPSALNLNTVISDLEIMLKRILREDINLETKLSKDLGNTMADSGQIEQIVMNLVLNARDAMPKGGKITIATSNANLDHPMADGNQKIMPGQYVLLQVRDSGVGMDAEVQARIFEPFFTTKGIGKGTGLGLATVYGIVSQNKGTIWVYSEPTKGTVFKVYLPLIDAVVETKPNIIQKNNSLRGSETVLVVEDQDDLRELVCGALKSNGYKVFEAQNGVKALNLVKDRPNTFNLVITDVVMPEMGGQALAEKISQTKQDIKLLFLSGYTEDTLVDYGLSGSHPHFLEKPFTLNALLSKVKTILS